MREENRKEILTRDIIKKEIKSLYYSSIRFTVIILGICIVCMIGFWFILADIHKDLKYIEGIFLLVTLLICTVVTICTGLLSNVKYLCKVSRDEFEIVTDVVDYGIPSKHRTKLESDRAPYRLFFSSYAEYNIPGGMNYKGSKEFCVRDEAIYNGAMKGDEFYLAIIDNKEIPIAYSKKLFELQQ